MENRKVMKRFGPGTEPLFQREGPRRDSLRGQKFGVDMMVDLYIRRSVGASPSAVVRK